MAADGSHSFLNIASEITESPYFAAELKREEARIADHKREAQRTGGVCQSGTGVDAFKANTIGDLIRNAEIARQRAEDFARTPRGIFLNALKGVEQMPTYEYDAERLRALYSRDLANADAPLNTKAVGAALAILNEIPGKDARRAIDALAELLLRTRKAA